MELPIKFPSDGDVVREEAGRFRALSPNDQRRVIDDMFRFYHFMLKRSDHREFAIRHGNEEEARGRAAIQEVVARHGG